MRGGLSFFLLTTDYLPAVGLHATAGPLPPPPRATININVSSPPPPRPPRLNSPAPARMRPDIQAVKQALQLPASVTAVLESKSIARVASKPTLVDKTEKEKELDAPKDNAEYESHYLFFDHFVLSLLS